jgi:hypothetical protein
MVTRAERRAESRRSALFKNLVALILVCTSLAVLVTAILAYETNQQQAEQIARRDQALAESQSEASKALTQAQVNGAQLDTLLKEVNRQNVLLGTQADTLSTQSRIIDEFRADLADIGFVATVRNGKVTITRVETATPAPKATSRSQSRTPSSSPSSAPRRQQSTPRSTPGSTSRPDPRPSPSPSPRPTPKPPISAIPTPAPSLAPTPGPLPLPPLAPLPTVLPLPSVLPTCVSIICLPKDLP